MAESKGPILYVDDEGEINAELLESEGYQVVLYENIDKAIEAIEEGLTYKLAIIDRLLPSGDGGEVAKISKIINPFIPIIGVSKYEAKMESVDLQINKPYAHRKLKKIIPHALKDPKKFLEDLCLYTNISQ